MSIKTVKIYQNTQFVLVYAASVLVTDAKLKVPNSILILEAFLKKNGILASQITICSLDKLAKEAETKKILFKTKKKKYIFLISLVAPFCSDLSKDKSPPPFWRAVANIRKYPESLIVVGGMAATIFPEFFMKDKLIDMIVLGEGETFIPHLLRAGRQNNIFSIPGTYALKDGKYILGKKRRLASFLEFYEGQKAVVEARSGESEKMKQQATLFLEFSRGCLFNCSYCYQSIIRRNLCLKPKEWQRSILPKAAANLIKIVANQGFKNIWIVDDSLTSLSGHWLEEFLADIKAYFPKNYFIPQKDKIKLRFYVNLVDFQRNYVMNFVKELSHFFVPILAIGLDTLGKEALLKFNRPHKNNYHKILDKVLKDLKPFIENETIWLDPTIIIIHPWITFKELRSTIKFFSEWGIEVAFWIRPSRVCGVTDDKIKIAKILEDEDLLLKTKDGIKKDGIKYKYKFAHAQKVLFPKDENDTDINRFISFLHKVWKTKSYAVYIFDFPRLLKNIGEIEKEIRRKMENELIQVYLRVLNEAERKWPRLPYKDYERICQQEVGEVEKIMNNNLKLAQSLKLKRFAENRQRASCKIMKIILTGKNIRKTNQKIKERNPKKISIETRENFFSLPDFSLIIKKIADLAIERDINLEIRNVPVCFMLGYKKYLVFNKNSKFSKPNKCSPCLFFKECPGILNDYLPFLENLIKPVIRELTDLEKCMLKILEIENGISTERVLKLAKGIKICASCTSEGEVFRVTDRLIKQGIIKREFKKGKYIWSLK